MDLRHKSLVTERNPSGESVAVVYEESLSKIEVDGPNRATRGVSNIMVTVLIAIFFKTISYLPEGLNCPSDSRFFAWGRYIEFNIAFHMVRQFTFLKLLTSLR